ncbi:11110_t:CDS:2, partial [Ambispora leptoticha]
SPIPFDLLTNILCLTKRDNGFLPDVSRYASGVIEDAKFRIGGGSAVLAFAGLKPMRENLCKSA